MPRNRVGDNPRCPFNRIAGIALACAIYVAIAVPVSGAEAVDLAKVRPRVFVHRQIEPFKPSDPVGDLAFSPDGKTLASGGGHYEGPDDHGVGQVKLWDVQTGKTRALLTEKGVTEVFRVAFSPDGKTVIAGCCDGTVGEMKGSICFWDAASGRLSRRLKWPQADCVHVFSLAVSRDGRFMAAGSLPYGDGEKHVGLRVWDIRTDKAQPILEAEKGESVGSVAFSPDNSLLLVGRGDGTTRIWDAQKWSVVRVIKGGGGGLQPVAVCPSPRNHLAAITHGEWATGAAIWDYAKGQRLRTMAGVRVIRGMAFSPDGALLAVGGDIIVNIPGSPKEQPPDGGVAVDIWDVATGKLRATFPISENTPRVLFSPSGEYLACCDRSGTIRVWDFRTSSKAR